uniref:Peptidase C1A papain C-terminal domain-containing protein n=1 Tax=Ditylenchus dipsaci TaxID=166011 RepID=A0A915E2N7_9BILA
MWEQEPETASLNTFPSCVSDTEVIIAPGNAGQGGVVPILSAASATTERVLLRHKKSSSTSKRVPLSMVQVLLFGLILLIVILCCIIVETWWSATSDPDLNEEDTESLHQSSPFRNHPNSATQNTINKLGYEPHSHLDRKFHQQLVADVNSNPKAKWKAVYNKFASRASDPQMSDVCGHRRTDKIFDLSKNMSLPREFDARQKWPTCESLHRVVNQGGCGSCWALSATSVMSDRICIHSNGSRHLQISAQDLIECCPHCGGCRGTVWALFSFVHWKEHGLVTGAGYGSYEGCKPYEKSPSCGSPCSIDTYNGKQGVYDVCWSNCQPLYDKTYQQDLNKAKKVYWVKPNLLNNVIYSKTMNQMAEMLKNNNVDYQTLIKRELMLNGPMIACFVVYDEFQHYKSGIYDSWGENGFFRVSMKEIPEEAAAGIPLI